MPNGLIAIETILPHSAISHSSGVDLLVRWAYTLMSGNQNSKMFINNLGTDGFMKDSIANPEDENGEIYK